MPRSAPHEHGYGGHRPESFSNYYKRSVLSEGCSCSERVLDPSNRPDHGGAVWGLLLYPLVLPLRLWRRLRLHS